MKLQSLDLIAFGPFTGHTIDFTCDGFGLHLIYGPNEAGKSSTLSAISDLLFGFAHHTDHDFVHKRSDLRIGACLIDADGRRIECVRRKGRKQTLRGPDDREPIDDGDLNRLLSQIDRGFFEVMFGIDHARLRAGGESLVTGQGNLGESLFAAGGGMVHLHRLKETLGARIAELYKSSGSNPRINAELKKLKAARHELETAAVKPKQWSAARDLLQSRREQLQQHDQTLNEQETELRRLQRYRDARPTIDQYRQKRDDLARLPEAPELPDEFGEICRQLRSDLVQLTSELETSQAELEKTVQQRDRLDVAPELLQEADEIERLREELGKYRKSESDRPRRESQRDMLRTQALEVLKQLDAGGDLDSVEPLRCDAATATRIRTLARNFGGLAAEVGSAEREMKRLQQKLGQNQEELAAIEIPVAAESLKQLLRRVEKQGDLPEQYAAASRQFEAMITEVAAAAKQLPLVSDDLECLLTLKVPLVETIERYRDELATGQGSVDRLVSERDTASVQRDRCRDALDQLQQGKSLPSETELSAARQLRDQGWQMIARQLSGNNGDRELDQESRIEFINQFPPAVELGDAFARSVERCDQLADTLRREANRVAEAAEWNRQVAEYEKSIADLDRQIADARGELSDKQRCWNELWRPANIEPLRPAEMLAWHRRYEQLVQRAGELTTQRKSVTRLGKTIELHSTALRDAMQAAGAHASPDVDDGDPADPETLTRLLAAAGALVDQWSRLTSDRRALADRIRSAEQDLALAKPKLAEARRKLQAWQTDWAAEMSRLRLADDELPETAEAVLQLLDELFDKLQQADDLQHRIDAMNRDAEELAEQVNHLTQRIAPDFSDREIEAMIMGLNQRLARAKSDDQQRNTLQQRIDELRQQAQSADQEIHRIGRELEQHCRTAKCDRADQLEGIAVTARHRSRLQAELAELRTQLAPYQADEDLERFIERATELDVDALGVRIADLEQEVGPRRARRDDLLGEVEAAKIEFERIDGGDAAAAADAKRRSIAAELENNLRQLAVLEIAAAALRRSIEQFAEQNKSPILQRGGQLFHRLTDGAFADLTVDYDVNTGAAVLQAVRAAGTENASSLIGVEAMSDGTCDQLFLALRLAGLEQWIEQHNPIPFIVDDVLINFDDERAAAALRVLAELSHKTQVIFFTHHKHLIELARDSLADDELHLHELITAVSETC